MHQVEARAVAVLEVGELLGEHHRAGGAVAVEQRDVRVGVGQHAMAATDSIGVMPEPAAMQRWRPPADAGRRRKLPAGVCTSISVAGPHLVDQPLIASRTQRDSRSRMAEKIVTPIRCLLRSTTKPYVS